MLSPGLRGCVWFALHVCVPRDGGCWMGVLGYFLWGSVPAWAVAALAAPVLWVNSTWGSTAAQQHPSIHSKSNVCVSFKPFSRCCFDPSSQMPMTFPVLQSLPRAKSSDMPSLCLQALWNQGWDFQIPEIWFQSHGPLPADCLTSLSPCYLSAAIIHFTVKWPETTRNIHLRIHSPVFLYRV